MWVTKQAEKCVSKVRCTILNTLLYITDKIAKQKTINILCIQTEYSTIDVVYHSAFVDAGLYQWCCLGSLKCSSRFATLLSGYTTDYNLSPWILSTLVTAIIEHKILFFQLIGAGFKLIQSYCWRKRARLWNQQKSRLRQH